MRTAFVAIAILALLPTASAGGAPYDCPDGSDPVSDVCRWSTGAFWIEDQGWITLQMWDAYVAGITGDVGAPLAEDRAAAAQGLRDLAALAPETDPWADALIQGRAGRAAAAVEGDGTGIL